MISLNVLTVNSKEVMVGSIKGEKFNVPFNKDIYNQLLDLSKKANLADTVEQYNSIMDEATSLLEDNRESEITTSCPDLVELKGNFTLNPRKALSQNTPYLINWLLRSSNL